MSQNKVLAEHLRTMRDTKDLTKKLAVNMDPIFGVRSYAYFLDPPPLTPSQVYTKRSTTMPNGGYNEGAVAKRNKRRRDKKRDYYDGLSGAAAQTKKKRNRASE